MPRFLLTIEYDGTKLAGWQRQYDRPTVQAYLEDAVKKFCGIPSEVIGAGRTDAGVHALAQSAHVDIPKDMAPYNVMHGINYHLSSLTSQIVVIGAQVVRDDFHARFSARKRSYCYRIVNRQARLAVAKNRAWHIPEPLNVSAMHDAAQTLLGHHDFTTFRSCECQAKSALKTLDQLDVIRVGEEIHIVTSARSFLHHQVRNMAGALRKIGNGKWNTNSLQKALLAKDRRQGAETAPAYGLFLYAVIY